MSKEHFLSTNRVARLDPYGRFERPVMQEGRALLETTPNLSISYEARKASELVDQEKSAWKGFLGYGIEVPSPPEELIDMLLTKEDEGTSHLGAYYWPGDAFEFSEDEKYPGWNFRPAEKYWKQMKHRFYDGNNIRDNTPTWMIVDITPQPKYDGGKQMYVHDPFNIGEVIADLRRNGEIPKNTNKIRSRARISADDLDEKIFPLFAQREGLAEESAGLLSFKQFNILTNIHHPEWARNVGEWLNDWDGIRCWYTTYNGLGEADFIATDSNKRTRGGGFRPVVFFPVEK